MLTQDGPAARPRRIGKDFEHGGSRVSAARGRRDPRYCKGEKGLKVFFLSAAASVRAFPKHPFSHVLPRLAALRAPVRVSPETLTGASAQRIPRLGPRARSSSAPPRFAGASARAQPHGPLSPGPGRDQGTPRCWPSPCWVPEEMGVIRYGRGLFRRLGSFGASTASRSARRRRSIPRTENHPVFVIARLHLARGVGTAAGGRPGPCRTAAGTGTVDVATGRWTSRCPLPAGLPRPSPGIGARPTGHPAGAAYAASAR